MDQFVRTEKTTLKRLAKRGTYDKNTIYRILDEGFVCHVGFFVDDKPFVIPTGYGRSGDTLYIHGSAASRMLNTLKGGVDVCITVTLIDGLVLARSAFHHSINYRSVVVFGRARVVESEEEKMEALRLFTDHVMRGRWEDARQPDKNELRATLVLSLTLEEASAKIRTGPPIDDEEDYSLPVWAGELPLHIVAGTAIPDPRLPADTELPSYVLDYQRPQNGEAS